MMANHQIDSRCQKVLTCFVFSLGDMLLFWRSVARPNIVLSKTIAVRKPEEVVSCGAIHVDYFHLVIAGQRATV